MRPERGKVAAGTGAKKGAGRHSAPLFLPGARGRMLCRGPSETRHRCAASQATADGILAAEAKVAGIILAAGASRRMGSLNKLLAFIAGKPLVRHAAESFVATSLSPIIIVIGYEADKVAAALEGLPVQLVVNPDHAAGQGSSVGVGVEALDDKITDAMIGLGDMPLLPSTLLDSLIRAHIGHEGHVSNITIPVFEGQRGNPVLWGKTFSPN